MYPTKGIGFRVRKIDWPASKYYIISDVELKTNRTGEIFGVFHEDSKRVKGLPEQIHEATKRGMWVYELADSSVMVDNGMMYYASDMLCFWTEEVAAQMSRVVDLESMTNEYWNDIEKSKLLLNNEAETEKAL